MNPSPNTDLTGCTTRELCEFLGDELANGVRYSNVHRYAYVVLNELEKRLEAKDEEKVTLSVTVTEKLREAVGAKKRSFDASYKRACFALKVWQGKYGPLTPEQAQYADQLLVHAIRRGVHNYHRAKLSGSKTQLPGYVNAQLDRIVNHENTHEGFQRRAAETLDITDILKEALS